MTSTRDFGRSLCLGVDAKGYGCADDIIQTEWQRALVECLDSAAAHAQVDRPQWCKQRNGDGEVTVLPEDGTEPRVVDDFVRELDQALVNYNQGRAAHERLRLRLALHHGVTLRGANGISGQGVVFMCRLLSSKPAHEALEAAPEAHLAVILSPRVYDDVVVQPHTSLRPADFRQVQVVEKELTTDAWLRVPGADVHRLDLPSLRGTPHVDQRGIASDHSAVNQAAGNLEQTDRRSFAANQDADTIYNFGTVNAPRAHFGPVIKKRGRDD